MKSKENSRIFPGASGGKVKLRSNSIFAFQNDDIYSNLCIDNKPLNDDEISEFLNNTNGNNTSNFFSNYGEKSGVFFNLMRSNKKLDGSSCSISSEVEKNLDFLDDFHQNENQNENEFTELNEAKLENISDININTNNNSQNITPNHFGISPLKDFINNKSQSHSSMSSEKSEKYDEVEEFSMEKNDFKDRLHKRLSLESASLTTNFNSNSHLERLIKIKLSNLHSANNYEADNNKSLNSIDFSASHQSSISPNVSFSPNKNKSNSNVIILSPTTKIKRGSENNLQNNKNYLNGLSLFNLTNGKSIGLNNYNSNINTQSNLNNFNLNRERESNFNKEKFLNNFKDLNKIAFTPNNNISVEQISNLSHVSSSGVSGQNLPITMRDGAFSINNNNNMNLNQNKSHTQNNSVILNKMQNSQLNKNMPQNQNINQIINQNLNSSNYTSNSLNMSMNGSFCNSNFNGINMNNNNMNSMNNFNMNSGQNFNQNILHQKTNLNNSQQNHGLMNNMNNSFQNNPNLNMNSNINQNLNHNRKNSFTMGTQNFYNANYNNFQNQNPNQNLLNNFQKQNNFINPLLSNMNTMNKNKLSKSFITNNINPLNNLLNINNIPNYLQDDNYLLENILTLLKDQNGCRMVQKKIEEKTNEPEYINKFYEKIENYLPEIINDQFGNYVVQKYIEIIQHDKNLIVKFFEKVKSNLYLISVNPYGTRFFQRALECMTTIYKEIESESLNQIFRELIEQHIMDLILDTNGNHVFQKILVLYPKDKNNFIYDELSKIAFEVAKLKQGGCIIQRAFDFGNKEQITQLVMKILKFIDDLINDEYGNFIIQQIGLLKVMEFNEVIFCFMKENLNVLARKKFSSNVIDKCILMDDQINQNKFRNDIIDCLIENKLVSELICDQFGNYVIQKCLQVSDGLKFMAIIHEIKSAVKTLKQTSYGRKIYELLIMQYGDYFQNTNIKYKNINDGRRNSHMNNFALHNKLEK